MTSSGYDVTIGHLEKRYPGDFETLLSIQTYPEIKFKVTRFPQLFLTFPCLRPLRHDAHTIYGIFDADQQCKDIKFCHIWYVRHDAEVCGV